MTLPRRPRRLQASDCMISRLKRKSRAITKGRLIWVTLSSTIEKFSVMDEAAYVSSMIPGHYTQPRIVY